MFWCAHAVELYPDARAHTHAKGQRAELLGLLSRFIHVVYPSLDLCRGYFHTAHTRTFRIAARLMVLAPENLLRTSTKNEYHQICSDTDALNKVYLGYSSLMRHPTNTHKLHALSSLQLRAYIYVSDTWITSFTARRMPKLSPHLQSQDIQILEFECDSVWVLFRGYAGCLQLCSSICCALPRSHY